VADVGKRGDEDSLVARLLQWRKGVVVVEEVDVTRGEGGVVDLRLKRDRR
jgi:hypothetical protein